MFKKVCAFIRGLYSARMLVDLQMLVIAHERQSQYRSISSSTKSVVFFGTPHGGTDVAKTSRILRDIIHVCTLGSFRTDLLKNLESKSAELVELAEQFIERANPLKIISIYEGRPLLHAPPSFPVVRFSADETYDLFANPFKGR